MKLFSSYSLAIVLNDQQTLTLNGDYTNVEKLCTEYQSCSVNNCPLHADYPNLYVADYDTGRKCKLSKKKRISITEGSGLKYAGMKIIEFTACKRWSSMIEVNGTKNIENLRNSAFDISTSSLVFCS